MGGRVVGGWVVGVVGMVIVLHLRIGLGGGACGDEDGAEGPRGAYANANEEDKDKGFHWVAAGVVVHIELKIKS